MEIKHKIILIFYLFILFIFYFILINIINPTDDIVYLGGYGLPSFC